MSTEEDELIELYGDDGEFRNKIATVDSEGKRIWVYPKKPKGNFYNWRKYLSYLLLIVLFGTPFIMYDGEPIVLFNIIELKFIILGIQFTPQDFHLFVIGMLIAVVFIVLFTVVFGRLFCGWICPQTIFMEMVFRRIEYWIEGDGRAQKKLNAAPWTRDKIFKKTAKQTLFILISMLVAHTFLAYIIGVEEVWSLIVDPVSRHWQGFVAMVAFTVVFYGVFSILREQVCTTICPYGRLQSVLLDENSLAVSYDFVRGEPRGRLKKKKKVAEDSMIPIAEIAPMGDCIDCNLCVQVCPTAIDIRNGTQLECVNCTACIDACDEVMVKIKKPKGLIRIDSHVGITKGKQPIWTKRVMAYSLVLVALIGLESYLFMSRSEIETLFLRTPGMLFQDTKDGYISNLYNYQLINKSKKEVSIEFKVDGDDSAIFTVVGKPPVTVANEVTEGGVFIKIPKDKLSGRKTRLKIIVYGDGEEIDRASTTFLGPIK